MTTATDTPADRTRLQQWLVDLPLTPNAISVTGLLGNLLAAVLIWQEHYVLGGVAFILGSIMDTLDGRYSRMSGKGTTFGAFLDSTLDRIEEGIVLTAVVMVYAKHGDDVNAGLAALAAVSSLLVSYTRARAEGLGLDGKAGIGSRAVRVVILSVGLVLGGEEIAGGLDLLPASIWVLAALGVFTTAQRMWHVRSQLNSAAGD
ncbi:CDP-diacylglycerol--glycerol-3-phosphate 3-phosphatidyltransferase [Patulibacter medicamentivorans]|uniref:CDP-diacylglycerol--glycerol-3-phosphate 3-phosphatidyltransferase n=1 Tax=Patulibacter medicamentivorans TaxID=1097667 RepID=H0EBU6_9ACTN|nr:CDP-alcohol phosphatidyltransferase family protein [Patulibacter medicamentivorans]EHN08848.1 CDP-diacylglycerol--glycerol-3-phosphate 3-phosphatidyltransferase [Patulibacter medicamentivorans]